MKHILFSHSYFLRLDPKQWETGLPYPPLGTICAASLMREKGWKVDLFDTMFAQRPEDVIPSLDHRQPDFFVIYDDGFNYLTKMCLTNMREAAFRMCRLAKERGCRVIVSGSDSTDHFDQYLQAGADFVILGEAEMTLLELAGRLEEGQDCSNIQGIAFCKNGQVLNTPRRAVIHDLDALPLPAWDLVDMTPYRDSWIKHAGYFSLNMATTRGCPYKCNWCAKPIYGNRYNSRSPENVITEIKWLKELFSFDHLWFCDDIFGLKPGWVNRFAELVENENLSFRFKVQCRADLLLKEDYVKALARAGCDNVWMGAESGSQKILDAMDKGTTVPQIYEATRLLKKHGIHPSFFIQFGYPGETREDIRKTIRMINELLPWEIGISVSYPLPGTVFYERVKAELKNKANWTDSDELRVMFRNTYSPSFYKQLHRYVHQNYRKHLAFEHLKQIAGDPRKINYRSLKKSFSTLYYIPASLVEKTKLLFLQKA